MDNTFATQAERWQAVVDRNRDAEGQFWLGVRSTGIFCRPGCPARTPLRKNVVFFDSLVDALKSGLRPCKRCHPLGASHTDQQATIIGNACNRILEATPIPALDELADEAGMSSSHFQKLFSSIVGLSPAQFARAARAQKLHQQLPIADSIIQAGLESGYASNAQLYADAPEILGMSPGAFRNKGKGETVRYSVIETWLGPTLIAATSRGICRLQFSDDPQSLVDAFESDFANATIEAADDDFRDLVNQAVDTLGTPDALKLPIHVRGTAFQMKVWHALRQIPFGSTIKYGELARRIGQPTAARAVASACGSNEVAVLIPCHRVVGKDGSLTGYRWGIDRKQALLAKETQH